MQRDDAAEPLTRPARMKSIQANDPVSGHARRITHGTRRVERAEAQLAAGRERDRYTPNLLGT